MIVRAHLSAQSLRFITLTSPVYLPDSVKALQERYGFVRVPTTADELLSPADNTKPIILNHGKFVQGERGILITALQLYPRAIAVDTPTSTDDSDAVLADLFAWANSNVPVIQVSPRQLYISQLEVEFEPPLEAACAVAASFGDRLATLVSGYGSEAPIPTFQVASFLMQVDPAKLVVTDFRIERRASVPYEQNLYFSQAPLQTADHITVLEEFERAMQQTREGIS